MGKDYKFINLSNKNMDKTQLQCIYCIEVDMMQTRVYIASALMHWN